MKKKIKIFGISTAILMILLFLAPVVYSEDPLMSEEELITYVENETNEDNLTLVLRINTSSTSYDALLIPLDEDPLKFYEAIVNGFDVEVIELTLEDKVIEIIENETLWVNENAEEEDEVATIISGGEAISGNLSMVSGTMSIYYRGAWKGGHNIFGWLLWAVYCYGLFFASGGKMYVVVDLSRTWNCWWYERIYFNHHEYIEPHGYWGEVYAIAGFKAKYWTWDPWHCWIWVKCWPDGDWYYDWDAWQGP